MTDTRIFSRAVAGNTKSAAPERSADAGLLIYTQFGPARVVVAEPLLVKHQLVIPSRAKQVDGIGICSHMKERLVAGKSLEVKVKS